MTYIRNSPATRDREAKRRLNRSSVLESRKTSAAGAYEQYVEGNFSE
jgi:hypothetical protein